MPSGAHTSQSTGDSSFASSRPEENRRSIPAHGPASWRPRIIRTSAAGNDLVLLVGDCSRRLSSLTSLAIDVSGL